MRRCLLFFALVLAPGLLQAQEPRWTPLGPFGGTISSIATHPTDPQVLYAAGNLPGVVRSTDGGLSWTLLQGSPFSPAFVAIDPARPMTVYAARRFSQVFKSTDGGTRWRLINTLPGALEISGLAVDPARPSRLYLGTASRGVWRSTDGGASWQRASQGLPANGNVQVLTLAVPRRPAGTAFVNTLPFGLFRTRDAGASWQPVHKGLPAFGGGHAYSLAIAPSDPRTLYVSFANRVYHSEDGGDSWAPAGQPPGGPTLITLAVHPRSPRTVYGGTASSGLFKSTNGGRSWEPTGAPTAAFVTSLAVDSSRKGTVYAGLALQGNEAGGVLRSADGGATWQRRQRGIPGLVANSVAVDPADPDLLIASLGTGLFRSADGGARFARTGAGFPAAPGTTVLIGQTLAAGRSTFYAVELSPSRLWRSTDAGLTWRFLPGPEGQVFLLRADPLDPDTLYAVARGGASERRLHRSTDAGASWTPLAPLPANCGLIGLALARESASSPATLYLLGSKQFGTVCSEDINPSVFRSSDGGASWVDASAGLPGEQEPAAITVDPQDSRVVYLGLSFGFSTEPAGVWKSTDSGTTWQRTGGRFASITALAASPVPGVLWVALTGGSVYRSLDAGATWEDRSGGQVLQVIRDFAFDPADPERVYAPGFGGVWVTEE